MLKNLSKMILLAPIIATASMVAAQDNSDVPSLREVFKNDFLVGVALGGFSQPNSAEGQLVGKHFNRVTAENSMKWESVERSEGQFNWSGSDQLVRFAKEFDMEVHGHVLVWYQQTAPWVYRDLQPGPEGRQKLIQRMQNHIRTRLAHEKGRVQVWDVANECVMADGSMRKSFWYNIIGPDYLKIAYDTAREADPNVKLVYNDFDTDLCAKRDGIVRLVNELNKDKKRVDIIGMQAHWRYNDPTVEEIERTIEAFESTGCKILISELDMDMLTRDPSNPNPYPNGLPPLKHQEQREIFRNIYSLFLKHSKNIHSVTLWGVTDSGTWLNGYPFGGRRNAPLLFDGQRQPKQAFWGVIDAAAMYGRDLGKRFTYQDGIAWESKKTVIYTPKKGTIDDACVFRADNRALLCAFSTNEDTANKVIKYVVSFDDGETWTKEAQLIAARQGKDCLHPIIGQNPDGRIAVSFVVDGDVLVYTTRDEGINWLEDDPNRRYIAYPQELFRYFTHSKTRTQFQADVFQKKIGMTLADPRIIEFDDGRIGLTCKDGTTWLTKKAVADISKVTKSDFVKVTAKLQNYIFARPNSPRIYTLVPATGNALALQRGLVMREY